MQMFGRVLLAVLVCVGCVYAFTPQVMSSGQLATHQGIGSGACCVKVDVNVQCPHGCGNQVNRCPIVDNGVYCLGCVYGPFCTGTGTGGIDCSLAGNQVCVGQTNPPC